MAASHLPSGCGQRQVLRWRRMVFSNGGDAVAVYLPPSALPHVSRVRALRVASDESHAVTASCSLPSRGWLAQWQSVLR